MKKNLFTIKKINKIGINFSSNEKAIDNFFLFFLVIFFGFFWGLIFLKLFQLTIVKGEYYFSLSENNRIRNIIVEPKRGKIIDRKGEVLAKNQKADIDLSFEQILKNNLRITSEREYLEKEAVAHLVGYIQQVDKEDLKNNPCPFSLSINDKIGKKGIEKAFNCLLYGEPGKKLVEVNAQGKFLRTIGFVPPKDGQTLQLAVDLKLQKVAFEKIKGKKAAVVAIKPKTGEVLVLTSSPSFSPQTFVNGDPTSYFSQENKPLFNRATEGVYPPGSIFKLITATASLEEKVIDENFKIEDKGKIQAGPLTFGNWYFLQYGKTDGLVDVVKALYRSNDIFFYLVGEKTGANKIKKWAEIFNLGKKTNIGIEEAEGLIPSPFWKKLTLKENWYTGDDFNLSIGQGYILVTPLQVAVLTSVFANNGFLCQPQLLKINQQKNILPFCQKLPISQKNLNLIKEGMKKACEAGGTGWPFFDFKVKVGCKTGTAESQGKDFLPHAWITVFAPFDNPEIVVTVLVENAGQGSDIAGPIAKEVLQEYFNQ